MARSKRGLREFTLDKVGPIAHPVDMTVIRGPSEWATHQRGGWKTNRKTGHKFRLDLEKPMFRSELLNSPDAERELLAMMKGGEWMNLEDHLAREKSLSKNVLLRADLYYEGDNDWVLYIDRYDFRELKNSTPPETILERHMTEAEAKAYTGRRKLL